MTTTVVKKIRVTHRVLPLEAFMFHKITTNEFDSYMQFSQKIKAIEGKPAWKPSSITCKFCNKDGFHWDKSEGYYRLLDIDGNPHDCRYTKYNLEEDDKEPF